ncbi:hypothetical protein OsI_00370 [Oryza sativa Indica Group]|uniref:Uncharacterized protein n=1 Tax=Oryza sativa subsp. indica TaxID=39946 RepID=B8AD85_ORYSI|nr:hypothetical protein OsI_00370 [Oryza sativa Indica Group]
MGVAGVADEEKDGSRQPTGSRAIGSREELCDGHDVRARLPLGGQGASVPASPLWVSVFGLGLGGARRHPNLPSRRLTVPSLASQPPPSPREFAGFPAASSPRALTGILVP